MKQCFQFHDSFLIKYVQRWLRSETARLTPELPTLHGHLQSSTHASVLPTEWKGSKECWRGHNSRMEEAETGGLPWVQGQSDLHSKIVVLRDRKRDTRKVEVEGSEVQGHHPSLLSKFKTLSKKEKVSKFHIKALHLQARIFHTTLPKAQRTFCSGHRPFAWGVKTGVLLRRETWS